jgi:acetyl esterase/lipase
MPERLRMLRRKLSVHGLLFAVLFVLCELSPAFAQAPPPQQQQDPRLRPIVTTHPDTARVEVRRDITYKTAGETALKLDLYLPPGTKQGARLPVVIFVNGVGDPAPGTGPKFKEWGQYTGWSRLVAATTGLAAISYDARTPSVTPDTIDLVKYVRENSAALGVDPERMALWSCSANVNLGLPLVLDETRKYIRAAVFYYGVMNDHPSRSDVPLFVARAGNDNPNLNRSIDGFVAAALADEVPVQLVNYADGQHGFDIVDDTERTRDVVRQTLDFLRFNLTRDLVAEEAARRRLSAPKFVRMIERDGVAKALVAFEEARKSDPANGMFAEPAVNALGYQLLQQGRAKDAIEIFKLNVAAYPQSANTYDSLSDAYEADGQTQLAIEAAEKALQLLPAQTDLTEQFRNAVKTSAEGKIQRLKGGGGSRN